MKIKDLPKVDRRREKLDPFDKSSDPEFRISQGRQKSFAQKKFVTNKQEWRETSLKGRMAETLFEELLKQSGNNV